MTDHEIQFWTLVATVVAAFGTFGAAVAAAIAAYISAKAANTWRDGLKQQRADECVATMENCAAAIGRTVSRKQGGVLSANPGGSGLDEAWGQWGKLRTAIAVFAVYQRVSFDDLIADGVTILEELNQYVNSSASDSTLAGIVNHRFGQLKSRFLGRL